MGLCTMAIVLPTAILRAEGRVKHPGEGLTYFSALVRYSKIWGDRLKACLISFCVCLPADSISSDSWFSFSWCFLSLQAFLPFLPIFTLNLFWFCLFLCTPFCHTSPGGRLLSQCAHFFPLPLLVRGLKINCGVRPASSVQASVFQFPWSSCWTSGRCIALCKARTGVRKLGLETLMIL